MSKQEEFDRSRCFTFFKDFHEQIMLVKEEYGLEEAFRVYEAIVDYGLYEIEPEDRKLKIMMGKSTVTTIENSQAKREKCFAGEDLETSRSIILLYRDHPEYSQNQIAKMVGKSKGKVNKTLQKYRNGGYDGVLDFEDSSNTNSNTNTYASTNANTYMTATVTEPVTGSITADHPSEPEPNEQPISCEIDPKITTETIELVYVLFQTGNNYNIISKKTGLKGKQIHAIIEEGKDHGFIAPEKRPAPPEYIPQYNGQLTTFVRKDFTIAPEDVDRFYHLFTDQKGEYKFDVPYVDEWFEEEYGYKAS